MNQLHNQRTEVESSRVRRRSGLLLTALFVVALLAGALFLSSVHAFPVSPLPDDNLVENPWFRSQSNPTLSGLDGWTDAAGQDQYWSSSQKESNPTADIVISGVCGADELYCGTAARLSPSPGQSGGLGQIGVDAYLFQVVQADPTKKHLRFFAHWVSHRIDPAEVAIYGGSTAQGPWTRLWTPFYHEQDVLIIPPSHDPQDLWTTTGMQEIALSSGNPYYKIEIHARLPEGDQRTGFKITGVYFAATDGSTPVPPPTSTGSVTPTLDEIRGTPVPTGQPTATPDDPRSTATATGTAPLPTATATEIPPEEPTATPWRTRGSSR